MAKAPFTLEQLTGGPVAVLGGMLDHPEIKDKRNVNVIGAMATARKVAQKYAVQMAMAYVQQPLQEALWNYVTEYGVRPEGRDGDDWDSALDDRVETIFEPYNGALTADWLARHTIDSRLHEDEAVIHKSIEFGKEVYRVLLHNAGNYDHETGVHTPVDILDVIGLTRADIQTALDERSLPSEEEELKAMNTSVFHVVNRIKAAVGMPNNLRDELDLASDNDDILAQAAAGRLGMYLTDIGVLRAFRSQYGAEAAINALVGYFPAAPYNLEPEDTVPNSVPAPAAEEPSAATAAEEADPYAAFADPAPSAPVVATATPAPSATADSPAPARRSRRKAEEPVTVNAGEFSPELTRWALAQIKQHSSAKDDALASVLGLSRGTLNNIVNGKNQRKLDPGERQKLADMVDEHLNALQQVSDYLRGVEQQ